jgi:hypothetical protein
MIRLALAALIRAVLAISARVDFGGDLCLRACHEA